MVDVGTRLLARVNRFSAEHPWSHNDAYLPFVERHARRVSRSGGTVALDVGCGTGGLLRRLAGVAGTVIGLEPDGPTAARARRNVDGLPNVEVREEPFRPGDHEGPRYDLVAFVASLHHLPLAQTLEAARSSLRPGGRLVVVGLARETAADLPWSVASMLLNPVIGVIRHPRRASVPPEGMTAPTAAPELTFAQVRATARELLPGVTMRRGLFWRYSAVWFAPRTRT